VYKGPFGHDEAVKIVMDSKESQFDPLIIDAFTECIDEFRTIAARYNDCV
jgi:putative two-component system response regulator